MMDWIKGNAEFISVVVGIIIAVAGFVGIPFIESRLLVTGIGGAVVLLALAFSAGRYLRKRLGGSPRRPPKWQLFVGLASFAALAFVVGAIQWYEINQFSLRVLVEQRPGGPVVALYAPLNPADVTLDQRYDGRDCLALPQNPPVKPLPDIRHDNPGFPSGKIRIFSFRAPQVVEISCGPASYVDSIDPGAATIVDDGTLGRRRLESIIGGIAIWLAAYSAFLFSSLRRP